MMKRKWFVAVGLMLMTVFSLGQGVTTLTFTGKDTNNVPVQLNSVLITNHTQRWQEVLCYPDTVLVLGESGIEIEEEREHFKVYQNHPNPFDGTTEFLVQLDDQKKVSLEIYDITGRLITDCQKQLLPGLHLFKATLTSPQTYLLSAKMENGTAVVKMINQGQGSANRIEYMGKQDIDDNLLKKGSNKPFGRADEMEYSGTATINKVLCESQVLKSSLQGSQVVTLLFPEAVHFIPEIVLDSITNVTVNSASIHCSLVLDGGDAITKQGICWNTTGSPTVADKCYVAINTQRNFVGKVTEDAVGVEQGITYYVRAFATNNVGTAYSDQQSFTTIPVFLPTVTTDSVTQLTYNKAVVTGTVHSDGEADVTDRGMCWSTSPNPTIEDSHTNEGVGIGSFTSNLTELLAGTTYYVRAYATNLAGTAYGEEIFFTTLPLPIVITDTMSNVTTITAIGGGNVISDGGAEVTARGVCWSTLPNPTLIDNHTSDGSDTGKFVSFLTDLSASTTYYVRAYAVNKVGTAYGEEISFTTLGGKPCSKNPTVTDYDNNIYHTIQIGNQCWMKENLRTEHYADGTAISYGSTPTSSTAYYNYSHYSMGLLYNWKAVMNETNSSVDNPSGVQGVCPTGWHVPSAAEWTELIDYVGNQSIYQCDFNRKNIAKSLAATNGWNINSNSCTVGNDQISNNATGFTACPAGRFYGEIGGFGNSAYFWSATRQDGKHAYVCELFAADVDVTVSVGDEANAMAVRCLLNRRTVPMVSTLEVSDVTNVSASCRGAVTATGGSPVIERGLCWSVNPNPTISNNHTSEGNGMGVFSGNLMNLSDNTIYYVRAYARNSVGTAYGEVVCFKTDSFSCSDKNIILDYDKNIYNLVLIGDQCWMKENLRTTHYADGTAIALGNISTTATAYRYYPNNVASNVATYGYLYNWKAVMGNNSSSAANPSGVQGICPKGWHVPSDAEWTQLTDYVSSQEKYQCDSNSVNIAKALASATGWNSATADCAVGNLPEDNNSTGFSALPAGFYSGGYYKFGDETLLWSSTEFGDGFSSYDRGLVNAYANVLKTYNYRLGGFSVRCLRNPELPMVSTLPLSNITSNTAVCGGNVSSNGGVEVTARGVCWSTTPNPTITDNRTVDSCGIGQFISNIIDLRAHTTYYVRAYATNSIGTAYGEETSFTTLDFTCGTLIYDYDNNKYNTIQIGNQCWMKENLRTTKYADGTSITQGISTSTTLAYWYFPNNNSTNMATYGLLYNWKAVMHYSSSSNTNPSGVQGICPSGWHVPSDAEWTQLTDYVGSQEEYQCDANSAKIAKALASQTGWESYSASDTPGNNPGTNNATGFSARPAGGHLDAFGFFGTHTWLWSATECSVDAALTRAIGYNGAYVSRGNDDKFYGFSVRCLRD